MKEGPAAIMKELSLLRNELKDIKFEDPDYPKLRARENIVHQFEVLKTKYEHVSEVVVLKCRYISILGALIML